MRIIVLFNLKAGMDAAIYEEWAKSTDIPGANALGSVRSFTVHRATGLFGSDAPSPYQYVEVLDIVGMDPFLADVTTEAFQSTIAAQFGEFADNPTFILTQDV